MRNKTQLFFYLLLITAVFILVEISYVLTYSGIFFGDYRYIAGQIKIPLVAFPGIVYFLFAQLLLHVSYALVAFWVANGFGEFFSLAWRRTEKLAIVFLIALFLESLLLNQLWFPNSKFSGLTSILFSPGILKISLLVNSFLLAIPTFFAFFEFLKWIFGATCSRHPGLLKIFTRISLIISFLIIPFFYFFPHAKIIDGSTTKQPNIILIGIDAIRPDFLGFYNPTHASPHLDNFLKKAVVFDNAFTPLARTFPAWVSVLTGQYPKVNHIRTDLANPSKLDKSTLISFELKKAGYQTIFAMDETRFSNIDESYGFDKVITPPVGINDFLLGTLNDFPISNLIINTFLGKWLFPYSYANRATFINYDPKTFVNLLQTNLLHPRSKPLFLAVHFCLPHYPYLWREYSENPITISSYEKSIVRVDQQFNQFLELLQKAKLLENTLVIVFSDHGEGLELPGDRITDKKLYINADSSSLPHFFSGMIENEEINRSAGHGTDVLGISQYHTLLALRFYGNTLRSQQISTRVSLLDIKPTILSLINLDTKEMLNGYSLNSFLLGKSSNYPSMHFFTESDFSPAAIHTIHPEIKNVLMQGLMYFHIDKKTGRVIVKDSMEELILASKQFADFYGDWVLAFYPQKNKSAKIILVNTKTGSWTDNLNSSFAKNAPTQIMLAASKNFFTIDLK